MSLRISVRRSSTRAWSVGAGLVTAACLVLACPGRSPADGPEVGRRLPTPPPGWRLEVVAEAPAVRHPSVVCCAPDGRVFVAEDPMDISTPTADLKQGRIRCLHPDGRITTFADGLHAVFGMQFLDGKLFVLHNPMFSVFSDGGDVGRDRSNLIESTNPNPWARNWNDHVPANFRPGHGRLPLRRRRRQGRLRGGRAGRPSARPVRRRHDPAPARRHGTGGLLHRRSPISWTWFSTPRTSYSPTTTPTSTSGCPALPTWSTAAATAIRTISAPGVRTRSGRWPTTGVRAATGATCYTEDGLPPEFRGDLYLADFTKRQVLRVAVARQGATFRAVERTDLFTDVPKNFRPVGIAWSADGLSLYICDWQHEGAKEAVIVGRLLKLSFTGHSQATPKPPWFVDAASGRDFRATDAELAGALSHPARSVRDVAQRRLAERGAKVVKTLVALLGDHEALPRARRHAIWALDAIDGGVAGRTAIEVAALDRDASVARQAIRQLGTRRVRGATELLLAPLRDEAEPTVRFQAATALGRLADPKAAAVLIEALDEPDSFVRYATFTAARDRIGRADPVAWPTLVAALGHSKSAVREGVGLALRETYDERVVAALADLARDRGRPDQARVAAIGLLAGVGRRRPAWRGEWWSYHPALGTPPAKSQTWAGTELVLSALRESLGDAHPAVRLAAVLGLQEAKVPEHAERLRSLFRYESDIEVRRAVLSALGALHDRGAGRLVAEVLRAPKRHADVLSAAIRRRRGASVVGK